MLGDNTANSAASAPSRQPVILTTVVVVSLGVLVLRRLEEWTYAYAPITDKETNKVTRLQTGQTGFCGA